MPFVFDKRYPEYLIEYIEEHKNHIIIPDKTFLIDTDVFLDKFNISSVVMPSNLVCIGKNAFKNCTNLSIVDFSGAEKLNSIADCAFEDCMSLESVTLSKSLAHIYDNAFRNCVNLKKIVLPAPTIEIAPNAFTGCTNLTEVIFASDNSTCYVKESLLISQENKRIIGCIGNMSEVTIPEEITTLHCRCFAEVNIDTVIIPDTVKTIEAYAFACSHVKKIVVSEHIKNIEGSAFGSPNLTEIILPEDLSSIEEFSFHGCKSLKYIKIPQNVREIHEFAFCDCSELERIDIYSPKLVFGEYKPQVINGVKTIFRKCFNLREIRFWGNELDFLPRLFDDQKDVAIILYNMPLHNVNSGYKRNAFWGYLLLKSEETSLSNALEKEYLDYFKRQKKNILDYIHGKLFLLKLIKDNAPLLGLDNEAQRTINKEIKAINKANNLPKDVLKAEPVLSDWEVCFGDWNSKYYKDHIFWHQKACDAKLLCRTICLEGINKTANKNFLSAIKDTGKDISQEEKTAIVNLIRQGYWFSNASKRGCFTGASWMSFMIALHSEISLYDLYEDVKNHLYLTRLLLDTILEHPEAIKDCDKYFSQKDAIHLSELLPHLDYKIQSIDVIVNTAKGEKELHKFVIPIPLSYANDANSFVVNSNAKDMPSNCNPLLSEMVIDLLLHEWFEKGYTYKGLIKRYVSATMYNKNYLCEDIIEIMSTNLKYTINIT